MELVEILKINSIWPIVTRNFRWIRIVRQKIISILFRHVQFNEVTYINLPPALLPEIIFQVKFLCVALKNVFEIVAARYKKKQWPVFTHQSIFKSFTHANFAHNILRPVPPTLKHKQPSNQMPSKNWKIRRLPQFQSL